MEKQKKHVVVGDLDVDYYSFGDIIKQMKRFEEEYPEFEDFVVREEERPYSDSTYLSVEGVRLETDEEFKERTQSEKIREAEIKERELEQLARLKRKCEK
jgi:hypothetical protein